MFIAKCKIALVMYGFQQNSWNLLFTSRIRGYRNTFNLHMSDIPGGFLPMHCLNYMTTAFYWC